MERLKSKGYAFLAALESIITTPFRYWKSFCKNVRNSKGRPSPDPVEPYRRRCDGIRCYTYWGILKFEYDSGGAMPDEHDRTHDYSRDLEGRGD